MPVSNGSTLLLYDRLGETLQGVPPENKQRFYDAVVEEMAKPETSNELSSEIKKLACHVASVNEAFGSVRSGLKMLDERNLKDKDGTPIPKYHLKWVGFQNRWVNLLWDSYRTATSAEVYIDEFLTTIIPVIEDIQTKEDREDAIKDLEEFSKRKNDERTRDEATTYSQAFYDLRSEIKDFSIEFDTVRGKLSEVHEELVERLRSLADEISKCHTIVEFFFNEIGEGAGKGMIMALSSFKPALVIKILASSLTKAGVGSSLASYEERDSTTLRYTEEKEHLHDLEALLGALERNKAYINCIIVGLEQFGAVWRFVAHDADKIAQQLRNCVVADGSMKAFKLRLGHLKAGYKGLGDALRLYATQRPVVKAGDEKVRRGKGAWGIRAAVANVFGFGEAYK